MSERSEKYNDIKSYYDSGRWNKKAVHNAVVKKWITVEEYEEITGEPYNG